MNIAHYRAIRNARHGTIFLITARAVQYVTIFADLHHRYINYTLLDKDANVEVTALFLNPLMVKLWKITNLILSLTLYFSCWTVHSAKNDSLAIPYKQPFKQ